MTVPPTLKPPAPPKEKPSASPRLRRRTEAKPARPAKEKPARARTDKPATRAEARAARAATAAPAAREAVAAKRAAEARAGEQRVVEVLAPAAARRAELRKKVGVSTATITENEAWVGVLLLGAVAVTVGRLAPDLPVLVRQLGGLLVSGSLAWGLAVRTGGRPIWATVLTAVIGATAIVTDWSPLLAGASIGTGVLAASLAFMTTVPAATFGAAIREALIATAVAWVGALGVVAYRDAEQVDVNKFGYVVFALSLVAAFALVYRLGAGLHGLGRRGYVVMGGAALLLFFVMAYTEAISQYGSRDVVDALDEIRTSVRDALGAVPHPITALLGYPALVWGVFMRARRRQGWWVCAFGVAATAPAATRMMGTDLDVVTVLLGEVYSLVVGFALGYLVIRGEQTFTGSRGRRARRDEEAVAHRPEPRRTRPLH